MPVWRGALIIRAAEKFRGLSKKLQAENPHEPQWRRGVRDSALRGYEKYRRNSTPYIHFEPAYNAKGETKIATTTSTCSPLVWDLPWPSIHGASTTKPSYT